MSPITVLWPRAVNCVRHEAFAVVSAVEIWFCRRELSYGLLSEIEPLLEGRVLVSTLISFEWNLPLSSSGYCSVSTRLRDNSTYEANVSTVTSHSVGAGFRLII